MKSFNQWWDTEMKGSMKGSRYLAKKAWDAAILAASECVVPGGDREAIKCLLSKNNQAAAEKGFEA